MFNIKRQSDAGLRAKLSELAEKPWNTVTTWERGLITRIIAECKRRGIDYVAAIAQG